MSEFKTGEAQKQTHQRYVLVAILFLTVLIAYIDRVNVSVLIADPAFLKDMGLAGNTVKQGLLNTLFLISYGIFNAVLGPVGDKIGPKKAMSLAMLVWGISMVIGGIAPVFSMLLFFRVLLGFGEGMHWPMQSKYVINWFPPKDRAKANSLWILGLFIGPAVGLPFFTWLISVLPWRDTFFLLAGLSLIPVILLLIFTSDTPAKSRWANQAEREYIENALEGEQKAEAKKASSFKENFSVLIKNYRFWLVTVYYLCQCCIWWGVMTWLPSYLKQARGFSWASMGVWSSLPYIIGAATLLLGGYLSDKVGRRAPFPMIGMILVAIFVLSAAYVKSNIVSAILLSLALGGIGLASSAVWSLLQDLVPAQVIGTGAGLMNGIANGGSAFAPVIIGALIAAAGGNFVNGLLFLVFAAVAGAICAGILTFQKY